MHELLHNVGVDVAHETVLLKPRYGCFQERSRSRREVLLMASGYDKLRAEGAVHYRQDYELAGRDIERDAISEEEGPTDPPGDYPLDRLRGVELHLDTRLNAGLAQPLIAEATADRCLSG